MSTDILIRFYAFHTTKFYGNWKVHLRAHVCKDCIRLSFHTTKFYGNRARNNKCSSKWLDALSTLLSSTETLCRRNRSLGCFHALSTLLSSTETEFDVAENLGYGIDVFPHY
ncbi:111aa long hypothetical protein [Pyrococcus horikoshii OT3]|uniref:Uncharacterized protein n=1 Tax=Pyrococcus horikoshii (strain ATCC 700860 / DSM 12428 / JCM 9974 / NBRC 100139 / OT-3) TaxID=70601 RepID=O57911_PYRHO|nr:111aa long hypothetical protein [Pyrococcus horikoshii OT3]